MFRLILHISFTLLFLQNAFCQVRTIKPVKTHPRQTNFGIGGGVTRSFVFLPRNVKEHDDVTGFHASLIYGGEKIFRGNLEYTYYKKINIEPTWYDIRAYTIEMNMQAIARFQKTRTYFYPVFGLSYNSFKGYFTGVDDFLHLSYKYQKNQTVNTRWIGLNIGSGFEQYIKQFSLYGEYKLRIGNGDNKQLTIMDVCFTFGARYYIRVPSIYKLFSGTKSRYLLESKESED